MKFLCVDRVLSAEVIVVHQILRRKLVAFKIGEFAEQCTNCDVEFAICKAIAVLAIYSRHTSNVRGFAKARKAIRKSRQNVKSLLDTSARSWSTTEWHKGFVEPS